MMLRLALAATIVSGLMLSHFALGEEQSKEGIAAKYVGDAGIEGDASVIFAEDFETGSLAQIAKRWGEASNKAGEVQAFSDDVPAGSVGHRSLQMTGTMGKNSGGHLYTMFKPGFDKVYLRFYTKFAPDHGYEHHFVCLGGYHPATPWPNPKAGTRPRGDDRIEVFIDPHGHYGRYPPPGIWGLYTYWNEMKISADGHYWGNVLNPATPVPAVRGRWTCVELMIKMNSAPDKYDGELALWVDGKPAMRFAKGMRRGPWSGMGFKLVESGGVPFEGLRLRTSMDLKINHLWLEHYVDAGAQRQNKVTNPNRVNRVWFDNIVVATEYIGPIQTKGRAAVEKRTKREDAAPLGRSQAASDEHAGAGVDNPTFRPNRIFSAPEDLRSPRFKELRKRYKLDEVVKGQADEFSRIIALRHWLHEHVVVDRTRPAIGDGDALKMLVESPKGGAYHCSHFMKMQNAILNASGYVTRNVFASAGEKEKHLSGAHGINEVWLNSRCKWVVLDAELDSHFEKDGVPLSALEIRDEVLRDGASSVFRIEGPIRKKLPRERDDSWGHTPRTYTWVAWYPEANEHTIWPKKRSSYEFVYEDAFWRSHIWYRNGKKHWAYAAGYFKPVSDREALYWTPNVLSVRTRIMGTGNVAEVEITSCTPNLKEYQTRQGSGEWKHVDENFTLQLASEREEWTLRSVNLAGVRGPEYRLVIQR